MGIKMSKTQFMKFVFTSIFILIFFFAYMDTQGLAMVNNIGGYTGDTYSKMHDSYMNLFWTFAYGMILAVALIFYYSRRDISEAVAIGAGSLLMLWSGLEDVIYYWLLGRPGLDASMPWLWESPLSLMSRVLGESTVTPVGLYLQLILGSLLTVCVVKWLWARNGKIFGVKY